MAKLLIKASLRWLALAVLSVALAAPALAYDAGMGDAANSLPDFFSSQGGRPVAPDPGRRVRPDSDDSVRQWSDPATVGRDDRSKAPNRPTDTDQWNVPKRFEN